MRFAVSLRRRSRSSPKAALPLEDICENLCLFDRIIEGVMCVPALRAKLFKEIRLSRFAYWDPGFYGEGRLDIKATRVVEW
jgi:hypothetical protein